MKKYSYLKVKLQEKNISYKSLALELNMSVSTLSNKLNGKAIFNLLEIERLLEILEVENCAEKCKLLNIS